MKWKQYGNGVTTKSKNRPNYCNKTKNNIWRHFSLFFFFETIMSHNSGFESGDLLLESPDRCRFLGRFAHERIWERLQRRSQNYSFISFVSRVDLEWIQNGFGVDSEQIRNRFREDTEMIQRHFWSNQIKIKIKMRL